MRFATAFSLLLATVASVPASVLALPHDFAGGVELEARTGGAEPPYYARRSLEDVKLFLRSLDADELLALREDFGTYVQRQNKAYRQRGRSLDDDELLAVREAASQRWFDARGLDEAELEARGGDQPPPYRTHDPLNGSKPRYRPTDPWPQGRHETHTQGNPQGHKQGHSQGHSHGKGGK